MAPNTATRVLFGSIFALFTVTVLLGASFSWYYYFKPYDATFASLKSTNVILAQRVYNETVARVFKDMNMMVAQQNMQNRMDKDIQDRIREQNFINQTTIAEIQAREQGFGQLYQETLQENATRAAQDALLQQQIDNATVVLQAIKDFDIYAMEQFMIKMANITDITADIYRERDERIAADDLLFATDVIIQNALVVLVNQLNNEINTRIAKDNLIQGQLQLIVNGVLKTMNAQSPIAGQIVLTALDPPQYLNISNDPGAHEIKIEQNGLLTINGVGPDPTSKSIQFIPGQGILIDSPSPHTIRIMPDPLNAYEPTNHARLLSVYPIGRATCWLQSGYWPTTCGGLIFEFPCIYLQNTVDICTGPGSPGGDAYCAATYGSQWTCVGPYFTNAPGFGRCTFTGSCWTGSSADESQCNQRLGEPWHCRNNKCVRDHCTEDWQCQDTASSPLTPIPLPGPANQWSCIQSLCVKGLPQGSQLPFYYDGPSYVDYMSIRRPTGNAPLCNQNCLNPEPEYIFTDGPNFMTGIFPLTCNFNTWDGQNCGFRIPNEDGTWLVTVTVTYETWWNRADTSSHGHFGRMFISYGGAPGSWFPVKSYNDGSYILDAGQQAIEIVSATTTLVMTSVNNAPFPRGLHVYAGFSYMTYAVGDWNNWVKWPYYAFVYQISKVA